MWGRGEARILNFNMYLEIYEEKTHGATPMEKIIFLNFKIDKY